MRSFVAVAVVALALPSLASAQASSSLTSSASWFGSGCATDHSVCARVDATPAGGGGYFWHETLTFYRVGAINVFNATIISDAGHVPEAAEGLYWFACCESPGRTLRDPSGSVDAGPMVPGATYWFPVDAYTLPAGDPRTADDILAIVNEYPGDPTSLDIAGMQLAIGSVAVSMTPEPATFTLLGGGLLVFATTIRRRRARA